MMIPAPVSSGFPPPWLQTWQPVQPAVGSLWQAEHLGEHIRKLRDTVGLLKAVQKELDAILLIKRAHGFTAEGNDVSAGHLLDESFAQSSTNSVFTDVFQCCGNDQTLVQFSEAMHAKRVDLNVQEALSLRATHSLVSTLKDQLAPLSAITCQTGSWEERSVAIRLAQRLQKYKRNKSWKKRKRRCVAEMLCKEHKNYDKADQDADEWRAREIAKDIARRKVENMKAIAKLKADEERKRLESELELVLVVEKLQELRSVRIQKLKKQGHFLPEEDDKFLKRVQAAVEEEERQAAAAADMDAAKDAIASAEESRKNIQSIGSSITDVSCSKADAITSQDQINARENERIPGVPADLQIQGQNGSRIYDSLASLPYEFYHYYHGSNNDMGTLIEVRRTWDAFIRPDGSRIPGHWVQPPPPADDVWASYLSSHE